MGDVATSGPFVDTLSRHWSELGEAAGRTLGEALGFNYGVKVVYAELLGASIEQVAEAPGFPTGLLKDVTENRLSSFKVVNFDELERNRPEPRPQSPKAPDPKAPRLEQIWYDVGFDLGTREGYVPGIRPGMDRAYEHLLATSGKPEANRIPSPQSTGR